MPKSSKKRKEKAADFAPDVSFRGNIKRIYAHRSIAVALPNQTIRTEEQVAEQGIPTTRRRLTYDDLLIHLRHYSPGTRKERCFAGLARITGQPPRAHHPQSGKFARLNLVIKDHSVRKSLISFLEWVLDQIPTATLIPHAPPLLLFAAAALAHISAPVRADSVRIISVLLARVPHAVVSGTGLRGAKAEGPGARILDGLLAALGVGDSRGVGSDQSLSNSTKSTLLATLSMFLQHALAISPTFDRPDSSIPTWFFASSFPSNTAFDSFIALLSVRKANGMQRKGRYVELNKGELMAGPMDFDLDILDPDETLESNASNKSESEVPLLVCRFVTTFLDNAPQLSLPTSMTSQSLELVLSVVELARLVYGALIRDGDANEPVFDHLTTFLGHMAPYFPFGETADLANIESINIKTREGLQTLNLAYAELVSLNISRTLPTDSAIRRRNKKGSKPRTDGQQIDEVQVGSTPGLPSALSLIAYTSLLPTLWALRSEKDVIPATMQHAASGSGAGHKNVKRAAVEFMGRIILINSDPRCTDIPSLDNAEVMEWVLGLPRTAWEFGEKDPRGTEVRARRRTSFWSRLSNKPIIACPTYTVENESKKTL
ncbi:rix1 complex component involved in 60S ribosome maturation domain-containing protein [Rhizoctonia solani AG-1 IA]|uniref:Rix1 complex component involved in 60S ribosome maturation domain-containing protein n=1 Tax=Thanatephorus cucumeris (strain AG1-IA) TaxID=983506 RepID=L8WM47_THACA|nr:rix1 complex component involved in 60S ribosome maturation domain-containing protein [Rhizoctonia solani AG-1 IA]